MYSLFDKFLSNCLTSTEVVEFKKLLRKKKNKIAFERYMRDQSDVNAALQKIDFEKAYDNILNVMDKPRNSFAFLSRNLLKYAAVFITIIATTYSVYVMKNGHDDCVNEIDNSLQITLELEDGSVKTITESASGTIVNDKGEKVVRYQQSRLLYSEDKKTKNDELVYNKLNVPYGKKFQVVLSDGTHIYLNSGSSLRYPTKFLNDLDRNVYLDGEAYFDVKKDVNHPFTVITEQMNTRVLGTKFNISSYKNEKNTSAVLVSGAVGVYNAVEKYKLDNLIRIVPGQRVTFNSDTIAVDQVNIEKYIAWTEGKLFFIDDRFDSILKELERNFNVSIKNNYSSLNQEYFTGTFETESLDQILKTFQTYTPFNYTINGNTILITK